MTHQPLISIALCTYNGGRFLAGQLDSLVNQTYKNIEIIAMDDCSSDGTYHILNNYAEAYPGLFTIYRNHENLGFLKNFEAALKHCNGELIALCDQDDLWYPEKLELQVAAIGDNIMIYHDSEFINDNDNPTGGKMSDFHNFYSGSNPDVFLLWNCVSGHEMLFKKELLKYALPFKAGFYHDWWLTYVAVNIGSIDFIPQCLVKYRRHEASSTINDVLTEGQRFIQDTKWLELCASFPGNKHPAFVRELYRLFKERINAFTSVKLKNLLIKNIDTLYYIPVKSRKEKLKIVGKLGWGMKGKNFWYTYIRPSPCKVHRI